MQFKDFLNSSLDRIGLKSQADYVEFGYGQVEPNHLSAQRTAQIYAQLPANPEINILEQGQFVKYDYAANDNGIGEVNFTGKGEWMLVYNEIKLYRDHPDGTKQWDCEFAMIKDDYQARIYTPYDWELPEEEYHNGMYLNGKDEFGQTSTTIKRYFAAENPTRLTAEQAQKLGVDEKYVGATIFNRIFVNGERFDLVPTFSTDEETGRPTVSYTFSYNGEDVEVDQYGQTKTQIEVEYTFDDVTKDVEDYYEWGFTNDPWKRLGLYQEKKMRPGTAMVPRVFKTNVGDIFTTNMIAETELAVGDELSPRADDGILSKSGDGSMTWQVVKVYTMPDGQKGVKIMRIA